MQESQTPDWRQMQATVAGLTDALTRSERRHTRFMRSATAIMVALAVMVGVTITNVNTTAYATTDNQREELKQGLGRAVEVIDIVSMQLLAALPEIEQAIMNNSDVQNQVQAFLTEQNLPATPENQRKYAAAAIASNVVGAVADTVVLIQRLREDSDKFRELGGPTALAAGLKQELQFLNRSISVLTFSIGSTLGRVGQFTNWMPW